MLNIVFCAGGVDETKKFFQPHIFFSAGCPFHKIKRTFSAGVSRNGDTAD